MADLIQTYLAEVRTSLEGTLGPHELAAVLLETEQHLRDRSTSLQELGQPAEQAQAAAIESFGPALSYSTQVTEAHEIPSSAVNRRVLMLPAVLGAFLLVLAELSSSAARFTFNPSTFFVWGVGAIVSFWAAMVVTSYRSRRFVPVPLVGICVAAGLVCWVTMSVTHLNLHTHGGYGVTARWDVALNLQRWQEAVDHVPHMRDWGASNIAAVHEALDRGVLYQLATNPVYFLNSAGWLIVLSLSANLIGASLGRARQPRRGRRMTRA